MKIFLLLILIIFQNVYSSDSLNTPPPLVGLGGEELPIIFITRFSCGHHTSSNNPDVVAKEHHRYKPLDSLCCAAVSEHIVGAHAFNASTYQLIDQICQVCGQGFQFEGSLSAVSGSLARHYSSHK